MRNVYCKTDSGKMEAVTQPNQSHCDEMMRNKFLEIFSRLLQHQQQNNHLLSPVTGLQEVVGFEEAVVALMRKSIIKGGCIKKPNI
jgi:hypothetical protein